MTARPLLIGTALVLSCTSLASAQLVKFEFLEQALSADDLSPDGKYVVGFYETGGGYIWSREDGYTLIGGYYAIAVSDDGTVVLGAIDDPANSGNVAALWTAENGWQSLGGIAESGCPNLSSPYELSADGSVAVGLAWDGCQAYGFRWTAETGMVPLELLANGVNRASVVSGDGNLIGGFAQGSFSRTPAIWGGNGAGQLLNPPNGDVLGEVHGISDDGMTLLGEWDGKAFRWEEGQGIEIFDTVISTWIGIATDIADDDTIVGFDINGLARQAWIRPNGGPAVNFRSYLIGLGAANLPANLEVCQAISANGNIIIGHNAFSNGWIVNLCVPDIDGDDQVAVTDLVAIIVAWGTDDASADLNDDGVVDVTDLVTVITTWGPCPY